MTSTARPWLRWIHRLDGLLGGLVDRCLARRRARGLGNAAVPKAAYGACENAQGLIRISRSSSKFKKSCLLSGELLADRGRIASFPKSHCSPDPVVTASPSVRQSAWKSVCVTRWRVLQALLMPALSMRRLNPPQARQQADLTSSHARACYARSGWRPIRTPVSCQSSALAAVEATCEYRVQRITMERRARPDTP